MKFSYRVMAVCVAIIGVVATALPVQADSFWFDPNRGNSISLEILKTDFESNADFTFTTAAFCLNGKFQVGETMWFIAEMPFAHVDYDVSGFSYPASNGFGNPYLGLETVFGDGSTVLDLGLRIPLADEEKVDANIYGAFSDVDRFGAFTPHVLTLVTRVDGTIRTENQVFFRGRVGPSMLIQTEDTGGDRIEMLLCAGGQVGLEQEQFRAWAGINSVTMLTEDSFIGDDRVVFEANFGAHLLLESFEPGLFVRFPFLTDFNDVVSSVIGLNVTFNMP